MISKLFKKENLPLFLIVAAIVFSPDFSLGTIEGGRSIDIRIEDILIVILGLVWIASFLISGKKKTGKPPLFLPILAWLSIGLISVLTNWIFMNIGFSKGFFFFLKEIEFFFLYFYLFYHIRSLNSAKFIVKTWIILGVISILLILLQFTISMKYGEYGPGLFIERGPLPSGGFFLILFANLFNIFLYCCSGLNISKIKKTILALAVLSLIIGVISSGSKTAILGLVMATILSLFFYQMKHRGLKPFFIGLVALFVIGGLFYVISKKIPYILSTRTPIASLFSRVEIWQRQFAAFPENPFNILFGLGKSAFLTAEESHSQYVRNFIETGIIGSLIFLFLIFIIIKKSFQGFSLEKDPFLVGLSSGLLVATLTLLFVSISAEAFIVVRIAEVYWFFAAITMAALSLKKQKNVRNFISRFSL